MVSTSPDEVASVRELNYKQAAEYLGIPPGTLRAYVSQDPSMGTHIPSHVRPGGGRGARYYLPAELDAWRERQRPAVRPTTRPPEIVAARRAARERREAGNARPAYERWSEEDEAYLCEHYAHDGAESLAAGLGKTATAVHNKAFRLGIAEERGDQNPWSAADLRVLRKKYGRVPTAELARTLNRTEAAVRGMARATISEADRAAALAERREAESVARRKQLLARRAAANRERERTRKKTRRKPAGSS
jgi:hypothetical protein